MTITIYERPNNMVALRSRNEHFKAEYGERILTTQANLFGVMQSLTEWVNNDLKDALLFEAE